MKLSKNLKINETAKLTGLTIRALHYYDKIGLIKPSQISVSGYRLYNDEDISLIYQIQLFREVGLDLQTIKRIITDKKFDRLKALKIHKEILIRKRQRLSNIVNNIDEIINLIINDKKMTNTKLFQTLKYDEIAKHQKKYEEESNNLYGNSDAYKESQKRYSKYSNDEALRIMQEGGNIYKAIADNMDLPAIDEKIQKLIMEWQNHITKYFYNCTNEILSGLGKLYITDQRFTDNINKIRPGLAEYLNDAIQIYCGKNV